MQYAIKDLLLVEFQKVMGRLRSKNHFGQILLFIF